MFSSGRASYTLVCQDNQAAVKEAKELLDGHVIGGTDAPKGVQFSFWWEIHQDILENLARLMTQ
jgi:hypothetical protein